MNADRPSRLLRHANLATMTEPSGYGSIHKAALLIDQQQRIAWLGVDKDLPADITADQEIDCQQRWITPGLIDCHTHLVYAGNRSDEFEQRLQGISYAEIARQGGGIQSTVNATRNASFDELLQATLQRTKNLIAEGVTRIEIKSGYGLNLETERRMLQVARAIGEHLPITVHTTFLGAHALPPEFSDDADTYIEHICRDMLPALASEGLIDAVDGFCESIGFSAAQIERVFQTAKALGLPVKLHAEQLSNQHGAALVARYQGLSADHLEYLDEEGIRAMASAGTVATLLPGAFYYLNETQLPPIDLLRKHTVPMAIATDHNPGTSPMLSLLAAMNMACVLFRLRPDEVLAGVTRHAAQALGVSHECGTLMVGKKAELAVWDIEQPVDLVYGIGYNPMSDLLNNR